MRYAHILIPVCLASPLVAQGTSGASDAHAKKLERMEQTLAREPLFRDIEREMAKVALNRLVELNRTGGIWGTEERELLDALMGPSARSNIMWTVGESRDLERAYRRMLAARIKRLATAFSDEPDSLAKRIVEETMGGR